MAIPPLAISDLECVVAFDGCPAGQVSRSAMRSVDSFWATDSAGFRVFRTHHARKTAGAGWFGVSNDSDEPRRGAGARRAPHGA